MKVTEKDRILNNQINHDEGFYWPQKHFLADALSDSSFSIPVTNGQTAPSRELYFKLKMSVATSGNELQCSFPGNCKYMQPANHVMSITDITYALLRPLVGYLYHYYEFYCIYSSLLQRLHHSYWHCNYSVPYCRLVTWKYMHSIRYAEWRSINFLNSVVKALHYLP
jgi:hypothetical protein